MAATGDTARFTFEIEGLGEPIWVARFEGEEAISQLFHFQILLTCKDPNIAFADVIGKPALLTLNTSESEPRHIHGIVSRFVLGDEGKKFTAYHATLVPGVWRLIGLEALANAQAWRFVVLRSPEQCAVVAQASSSSNTAGRGARARARATRCCWPPDSMCGQSSPKACKPTRSSASLTRGPRSARG